MKLRRLGTSMAFVLVSLAACSQGTPAPEHASGVTTPDSLASAFRRAHERRDVPALLALFKSDCATSEVRTLIETTLRSHLDHRIETVRVELPLGSRAREFVRDGKIYELSVPAHGEMVVVYDSATGPRSSYPFGPADGGLRLGTMCRRAEPK